MKILAAISGSFDGISAGSTIILQATNDIAIVSSFVVATATGNANNSLVMQAGGNITIAQNITVSGTGTLHLEADSKHSSSGGGDGFPVQRISATVIRWSSE